MRLDAAEQQALQLNVLNEWRSTRSLILFEMLKRIAEPLVENEVSKYKDAGVRLEDLRQEADDLLKDAFASYTPACAVPLITWVQTHLSALGKRVGAIRSRALAKRGK